MEMYIYIIGNIVTGLCQERYEIADSRTTLPVNVELVVVEDAEAAARAAGELLANAARAGGHVALSGGKAPEEAYRRAAEVQPDWSGVEVWWGDERCVPPDDERSNFGLAKRTLLDNLQTPPRSIHRARGELDPNEAAAEYDAALAGVRLRLNFLGIGPDGHTASLFPNAPGLAERERRAITAEPALDPQVTRITMTPPMLRNADLVLFLATGEAKAEAVARAFGGPENKGTPASMIRADGGRTVAVLDRDAAALLEHA
jgi:6-phosphogluconolactonase